MLLNVVRQGLCFPCGPRGLTPGLRNFLFDFICCSSYATGLRLRATRTLIIAWFYGTY